MAHNAEKAVADHYGREGLRDRIFEALQRSGLDLNALKPADLAPVDEFHMGGRAATTYVANLVDLPPGTRVLDIGSGLGGVARYLAGEHGCHVTGIDLTPEYVRIAGDLTERTGLSGLVDFVCGSALNLPWPAASFDAVVTFHAAMNISDRPRLYAEAARVLRPKGVFAIYDVLKGATEGMQFPVPWAETADTSFLVTTTELRRLLDHAGFDIEHDEDRREVALEHHRSRLAELSKQSGSPVLGLHLLQGETAGLKSRNMVAMLETDRITLGAITARRRN